MRWLKEHKKDADWSGDYIHRGLHHRIMRLTFYLTIVQLVNSSIDIL